MRRTLLTAVVLTLLPTAARAVDQAAIDRAVDSGLSALRQLQERDGSWNFSTVEQTVGSTSLAGLTLLMCGADKDDKNVKSAAGYVRYQSVTLGYTYSISLAILFLDRLGDPADVPLIESLAARLVAGQNTSTGGWSYDCPVPVSGEQRRLSELVSRGRLDKNDATQPATPRRDQRDFQQRASLLTKKPASSPFIRPDNSVTQFAVLALWVSRRYGYPVDNALRHAERHFRSTQNSDGGWPYTDTPGKNSSSTPTMTCAGILGVAVGLGVNNDKAKENGRAFRDPSKDPILKSALLGLAKWIDVPPERLFDSVAQAGAPIPRPPGAGRRGGGFRRRFGGGPGGENPAGVLFYYLWSLERVAVALNLDTIGKKDWYAWGTDVLLSCQDTDGSWQGNYGANVDTCFALLFLKRANLISDLTTAAGRVSDPGRVVLRSGDAIVGQKPDDKDMQIAKPESATESVSKAQPSPIKEQPAAKLPPASRTPKTSEMTKENVPVTPKPPDSSTKPQPAKPIEKQPAAASTGPGSGDATGGKLAELLLALPVTDQEKEIERLGNQKGGENTEALAAAVPYLVPEMRRKAREALARREARMSGDTIRQDLSDENSEIRRAAALACALKKNKDSIPQLIKLLDDKEATVARAAHASLKELSGHDFGPAANADAEERKTAISTWEQWWKQLPR